MLTIHVTLAQTPGTARTAVALLLRNYYTLSPRPRVLPLGTWKNLSHLVQTEWHALHLSGAPSLPYSVTEFCSQANRLHRVSVASCFLPVIIGVRTSLPFPGCVNLLGYGAQTWNGR